MSSDTIFQEARALPLAEQVELCRNLWDGIVSSRELTPGEKVKLPDGSVFEFHDKGNMFAVGQTARRFEFKEVTVA